MLPYLTNTDGVLHNATTMDGLSVDDSMSHVLTGIFNICDEEQTGSVRVSRLVAFLKDRAGGSEIVDYLGDLITVLDEEGNDREIDQQQYEAGMQTWMQNIQQNTTADRLSPKSIHQKNHLSPEKKFVSTLNQSLNEKSKSFSAVTSTYSNDSMETSDLSWDHSDVHNHLEELEVTNKKLIEENLNLKKHLNATEDQNSMILHENDVARGKLLKYEKLMEESKHMSKGYEELRSTVVEYQNSKNDLLDKTHTLERENTSFQNTILEYEAKIRQLDASLEGAKEEKKKLTEQFHAQKQLLNQVDELRTSKESVIEECANKSDYMTSVIAELSLANEVLKAQKNNAESEISELKQEMNRFSMLQGMNAMSTPICSKADDRWPQTLHQELRAELDYSECGDESYLTNPFSPNRSLSSISSDTSPRRYSNFAHECRTKFRLKKEEVFKKLEEIVNVDQNKSSNIEKTAVIVGDLNNELESFTEKIAEFAQGKQAAEKKVKKLTLEMKKLQDENVQLQDARDKALIKFGDLSMLSMETDAKIHELVKQLGSANKMLDKLDEEKKEERRNVETSERFTSTDVDERDQRIMDMKSLIEKLEERNIDSAKKIFEFEDGLSSHNEEMEIINKKLTTAQNELNQIKSKHLVELQELYTVVLHNNRNPVSTFEEIHSEMRKFMAELYTPIDVEMCVRQSPEGYSNSVDSNCESRFYLPNKNCQEVAVQTDLGMNEICLLKCDLMNRFAHSEEEILVDELCSYEDKNNNSILLQSVDERFYTPQKETSLGALSPTLSSEKEPSFLTNNDNTSPANKFIKIGENTTIEESFEVPSAESSDSEAGKSTSRHRKRMSRASTVFDESPEHKSPDEAESTSSGTTARQRRHGVSAEPVRVSWSEMRESFKSTDPVAATVQEDEPEQPQCQETTPVATSPSPVPLIEIQDDNCPPKMLTESPPPLTKKDSLQVPPLVYEPGHLALLIPANCGVMIDDKELEKKYNRAVFAFNTDQFTLQKRIENQERARDVAESGLDKELSKLRTGIENLNGLAKGTEEHLEAMLNLGRHCDILQKSAMKISAQSEQHGCYQQEHRMKNNTEVTIAFVEQLKLKVAQLTEQLSKLPNESIQEVSGDEKLPANETEVEEDEEPIQEYTEEFSKVNRFSALSKSMLVARRLKRRSPLKKVSFASESTLKDLRRQSGEEIDLNAPIVTPWHSRIVSNRKVWTFIVLASFLLVAFVFLSIFVNSIEVNNIDTIRLHDLLLRYIPHTLEYQNDINIEEELT